MVSPPSLLRKPCFSKKLLPGSAIHQKTNQTKKQPKQTNNKKTPTTEKDSNCHTVYVSVGWELKSSKPPTRNAELPVACPAAEYKDLYRSSHCWAWFSSKFQGSHQKTGYFFTNGIGGKSLKAGSITPREITSKSDFPVQSSREKKCLIAHYIIILKSVQQL